MSGFPPGVLWGLKARDGKWLPHDHKASGRSPALLGSRWQGPRAMPHRPHGWTQMPSPPEVFWTCLVVVAPESLTAVTVQVLRCRANPVSPPAAPSATQERQPKPPRATLQMPRRLPSLRAHQACGLTCVQTEKYTLTLHLCYIGSSPPGKS